MNETFVSKHSILELTTFLKIGEVVLNYELESIAYAKSMFRKLPQTPLTVMCDHLRYFQFI